MGKRATTCPLDILDHSLLVNGENTIFNDLRVRGCNPSKVGVLNTKDELVHLG